MFRQSPSRNQRSKGIKGKSVFQICLLLAVCFWLIYQVKHSHDKKKEFDEKNANLSLEKQSGDVIIKFGRKDIRPEVEETSTDIEKHVEEEIEEEEIGGEEEKHEEEDTGGEEEIKHEEEDTGREEENKHEEEDTGGEEENKHEEEDNGGEEENKHEEEDTGGEEENKLEEQELEEDGKTEEKEDGDDEIDNHGQEKSDIDVDRAEAFIGEEEREEGNEKESEKEGEKEGQTEDESSSEDHNHDGGERNTHEAREEHYKADDASSAVTHDAQSFSTETEKGNLENPNENTEMGIIEQDNEVNNTEETDLGQNATVLTVGDGQMAENGTFNATTNEEKVYEIVSSKSEDASISNSTIETVPKDQLEVSNNSTEASTETHDSSPQNGTETISVSTQAQFDSNSTISHGEPFNSSVLSEPVILEQGPRSNASSDIPENEKSDNSNETDGMKDGSDSLKTENVDEDQHEHIDSSGHLEEKDVRTDLDTLPEIQTEGSNTEDTATE